MLGVVLLSLSWAVVRAKDAENADFFDVPKEDQARALKWYGPPLGTMTGIDDEGNVKPDSVCTPAYDDADTRWTLVEKAIEELRSKWYWEQAAWLKSTVRHSEVAEIFANVEESVDQHSAKIHNWFFEEQGAAENDIMKAITEGTGENRRDAVPIYRGNTAVQHVEIGNSRLDHGGQYVKLDGYLQSSSADEALYHESLVHQAMVAHPNPKRVFIGGGGEGANLREILKHPSVESIVMVDFDGEFVELCRKHLLSYHAGAFDDPRVDLRVGDAREYMLGVGGASSTASQRAEKWDVVSGTQQPASLPAPTAGVSSMSFNLLCVCVTLKVILDFPDFLPDFTPQPRGLFLGELYSLEFYAAVKSRLNPGGVTIAQGGSFEMAAVWRTLGSVFQHVALSFTMMFTYPIQTWFIASDTIDAAELTAAQVDDCLAERMGGEVAKALKWYSGETQARMLSLTPQIKSRGLLDKLKCIIVDRPNMDALIRERNQIFEQRLKGRKKKTKENKKQTEKKEEPKGDRTQPEGEGTPTAISGDVGVDAGLVPREDDDEGDL